MNDKYLTKVAENWTDDRKVRLWTMIELLNLEVYDPDRAKEARIIFDDQFSWDGMATQVRLGEQQMGHEVEAYIAYLNSCYKTGLWHKGLTSSDLVECSTAWAIDNSMMDIRIKFCALRDRLMQLAIDNNGNIDVAYTHGQPAEPTSWGYRASIWLNMLQTPNLNVQMPGKVGGAVGTGVTIHPILPQKVAAALNIHIYNASTQIVARPILAFCLNTVSEMAAVLSKIANDLRVLYTLKEIEFDRMPVGSTAMPHKVNPYELERIVGLSQLIMALVDCVNRVNSTNWLERDLVHSSVERESLPMIYNHTYYCMCALDDLLSRLKIKDGNVATDLLLEKSVSSIALTELLEHDTDRVVARENAKVSTASKVAEYLKRVNDATSKRMWQIIKGQVEV